MKSICRMENTPMDFCFSVSGTPRPQPRPRFIKGRAVSTTSKPTKIWQEAIRRALKGLATGQFTEPVAVEMVFTFETKDAERVGHAHGFKPDADNLAKLVMDELTKAKVWVDDGLASSVSINKLWGWSGGLGCVIKSTHQPLGLPTDDDLTLTGTETPDWLNV